MATRPNVPFKSLASLFFLLLFIVGVGPSAFFPSVRLLEDTSWNSSFIFPHLLRMILSLLWVVPVGLGTVGWNHWLRSLFFARVEGSVANLLGLSTTLAFFSLFTFALAINGIFYWPLTALFFLVGIGNGLRNWKGLHFKWPNQTSLLLMAPVLLVWGFEYFSPPLVWDAVLDHFRYAREVSRLHQIPFQWVNHTGDMPKAAELVLAGFWNLGGEPLSKLALAIPAFLTTWLLESFLKEGKPEISLGAWFFWTCPYFLALYAFGYVEGFLAFYEVLALFCFWKGYLKKENKNWMVFGSFFLGYAMSIKYTAALAVVIIGYGLLHQRLVKRDDPTWEFLGLTLFALPIFPWFFKNWLAFGNSFYPMAISLFGSSVGYSPEMERGLLVDTGTPWGMGIGSILGNLWDSFFTTSNAVNAAWTPLFVVGLPWMWPVFKKPFGRFLGTFSALFFCEWLFVSSSFRHASAGALVLVLLAALGWNEAFREKDGWARPLLSAGLVLSFWLCLSAQLTTTAPYASALGLEDPLARLKRHYSYDIDIYRAYRYIEDHSDARDKVMAFAVFQTYSFQRTTFVDFKWKRPIFLEWASHCRTAEQLAQKLREEGVAYFLYQSWEAKAMARVEKDFKLESMPLLEYQRFWSAYMEPELTGGNVVVYRVLMTPRRFPVPQPLPGLEGS